jgi:hypothetical protein
MNEDSPEAHGRLAVGLFISSSAFGAPYYSGSGFERET